MSTGHLYKLCSQRPFLLLHVRCTRDNVKLQTVNPKRIQKNIKEWNEFGIKPCCICLLCFLPEPRRRQSWTLHDCDHSCVSSSGIPRPSYASVQWIKGIKGLIQTSCPDTNPTNSKRLQTSNYKYNNDVLLCCCLIFLHLFREITRPTLSGNVQSSASSWGGHNPESPCTVWKHHKSHHFRTPHLPRFSSSTEFIHVMNENVLNAKTSLLVSSYTKNTQNTMLSLLTLMVFLVRTPLDFTCDELVSVTQSGRISVRLKRWNEAVAAFDAFDVS